MLHKNSMAEFNRNTFPFTKAHFEKFNKELKEAGSFDALMIKKKALKADLGMKYIALYSDIKEYKEKYLTGVYESLREYYDTEMPYVFWNLLQEYLSRSEEQTA